MANDIERVSRDALEETRAWLAGHPAGRGNLAERRARMAVIQRAADALTPEMFKAFEAAWGSDPGRADAIEEEQPALWYLRRATDVAIEEIRAARVSKGLVAWHLYNMGYVFRTPEACFAIDVHLRSAERLAAMMDFLLVTHPHRDHVSEELFAAMFAARKPVVTSWDRRGLVASLAAKERREEFRFGTVVVKVDVGDHHPKPEARDNMLMFQVECGKGSGDLVIYDSGDGCNPEKMRPDRAVDVYILHTAVGKMKVVDAILQVKPKVTLVSHVLELGHSPHPPEAWRWSFDYAYETVRELTVGEAIVPTWGERWVAPGTEWGKGD